MVVLYVSPVKMCDTFILERTVELCQSMKKMTVHRHHKLYLILNIFNIVDFFYVLEV